MGKGKVLIDADIVAYRAAFSTQGSPETEVRVKVDDIVSYILKETVDIPFPSPQDFEAFITGKGNFREAISVSHVYKGNRKGVERPEHLDAARQHLVDRYGATTSSGEEADDLISKRAASLNYNCVVASIDKDMLQIPCWHFNFVRGEWTKVSPEEGLKFFYTQILTGDRADNIVGLHGIGPKKAEKILEDCDDEESLWNAVLKAYDSDKERVIENARLLWLRRYENELWEPPTQD